MHESKYAGYLDTHKGQELQSSRMHESKCPTGALGLGMSRCNPRACINQNTDRLVERLKADAVAILAHARIKMHRGPLFFLLPLVAIFAHT